VSQQGLRRRVHLAAERIRFHSKIDSKFQIGQDSAGDIDSLLAAHKQAKRELALIRKLARMSGVDKHWWKVGGVTL